MNIEKEPNEIAAAIREYLWNNEEMIELDKDDMELQHPLAGQCYVASEAFYHLHGHQHEWTPQQVEFVWYEEGKKKSCSHWFLQDRDKKRYVDLTVEQFDVENIERQHHHSMGRGFVPPTPSKRAKEVMQAVKG